MPEPPLALMTSIHPSLFTSAAAIRITPGTVTLTEKPNPPLPLLVQTWNRPPASLIRSGLVSLLTSTATTDPAAEEVLRVALSAYPAPPVLVRTERLLLALAQIKSS